MNIKLLVFFLYLFRLFLKFRSNSKNIKKAKKKQYTIEKEKIDLIIDKEHTRGKDRERERKVKRERILGKSVLVSFSSNLIYTHARAQTKHGLYKRLHC